MVWLRKWPELGRDRMYYRFNKNYLRMRFSTLLSFANHFLECKFLLIEFVLCPVETDILWKGLAFELGLLVMVHNLLLFDTIPRIKIVAC